MTISLSTIKQLDNETNITTTNVSPNQDTKTNLFQHYKSTLINFGVKRTIDGRSLEKVLLTIAVMLIITFTIIYPCFYLLSTL